MRIVFCWAGNDSGGRDGLSLLRERILQSGLPFAPAKGSGSCPRVSYGPAAGREIRTEREYADIYLKQDVPSGELQKRLSDPATGLDVLEVTRVPYAFASVQDLATAAVYRVEGNLEGYSSRPSAQDYFSALQIKITRTLPNGMTWMVDVKPYIRSVQMFGSQSIRLTLQCVEGKWTNPQELVAAWLGVIPSELSGIQIIREGLYWQDSAGELHLI